ncbi:MAG: serpin family protein, partial [Candidatus Zixiibacteriota bacterium]
STIQIVEIPYEGGNFSMVIFLPDIEIDINDFTSRLSYDEIDAWFKNMKTVKVKLQMPEFKTEATYQLKDAMSFLGMGNLFRIGADFSNIGKGPFYIKSITHKAKIDMNKDGTKASASTIAQVISICGDKNFMAKKNKTYYMHIDHPFLFCVKDDNSNVILFIGKILAPVEWI